MGTSMLLSCVFGLTFCAAIVPLGPAEVYVALTVTSRHLTPATAAAVAAAAAVGQVSGKFVVFQGARRSWRSERGLVTRARNARLVRRLYNCDATHPSRVIALVGASSITGLPPFALVAPVAGTAGISNRTFFLTSVAGRLIRFLLIAIPIAT
jgi:membrane protein YqaA with SNARE-associated domain